MTTVDFGMYSVEYTDEELKEELHDLQFFRDAFLVAIASDITKDCWDIIFNREQMLEIAKEKYKGTEWTQEFIDKCFKEAQK